MEQYHLLVMDIRRKYHQSFFEPFVLTTVAIHKCLLFFPFFLFSFWSGHFGKQQASIHTKRSFLRGIPPQGLFLLYHVVILWLFIAIIISDCHHHSYHTCIAGRFTGKDWAVGDQLHVRAVRRGALDLLCFLVLSSCVSALNLLMGGWLIQEFVASF